MCRRAQPVRARTARRVARAPASKLKVGGRAHAGGRAALQDPAQRNVLCSPAAVRGADPLERRARKELLPVVLGHGALAEVAIRKGADAARLAKGAKAARVGAHAGMQVEVIDGRPLLGCGEEARERALAVVDLVRVMVGSRSRVRVIRVRVRVRVAVADHAE